MTGNKDDVEDDNDNEEEEVEDIEFDSGYKLKQEIKIKTPNKNTGIKFFIYMNMYILFVRPTLFVSIVEFVKRLDT